MYAEVIVLKSSDGTANGLAVNLKSIRIFVENINKLLLGEFLVFAGAGGKDVIEIKGKKRLRTVHVLFGFAKGKFIKIKVFFCHAIFLSAYLGVHKIHPLNF